MQDFQNIYDNSNKKKRSGQFKQMIKALGPAFGPALFLLLPGAYLSRLRGLRSPFSPTLYKRRRVLPKVLLDGRVLPNEPYLRPTLFCDCHAPEIIALADKFRSNASNDWDYALSIYNFVRNDIYYAIESFPWRGAVGTLEMGCGFCIDKANVLVALARAGGIPARYCQIGNVSAFKVETVPWLREYAHQFQMWGKSADWRLRKIGGGIMRRVKQQDEVGFENAFWIGEHIMAELKIGNSWILADPTWSDEEAIAHGMPLPRLGYDPIALFGLKGVVVDRSEVFQVGRSFWVMRWLLCLVGRGLLDIVNQAFEERRQEGRKLLAEIGEKEYMRRMQRYYIPLPQAVGFDISLVA
jgi:hypothetical protein